MIAGIVLAAGRSSRLGRPKQLLPLLGAPLIRHTLLQVLESSLDAVVVVVGHYATEVREAIADLPVRIVINPNAAKGQSTSVLAGLAALNLSTANSNTSPQSNAETLQPGSGEIEAVVFLLADQPSVDPAVIDALIARWHESHAPIVAPCYRDGLGNPVLFDREVLPELTALTGDVGAREVIQAHRTKGDLVLVPIDRPMPPDVDTEEDYAALITALKG